MNSKAIEMKIDNFEELIKRSRLPFTKEEAWAYGYEAGKYGANTTNSNFKIFSNPENTEAWSQGKSEGEKNKK